MGVGVGVGRGVGVGVSVSDSSNLSVVSVCVEMGHSSAVVEVDAWDDGLWNKLMISFIFMKKKIIDVVLAVKVFSKFREIFAYTNYLTLLLYLNII